MEDRGSNQRGGVGRNVALCLLAAVLASVALRRVLPGGSGLERDEIKLDHFRTHKDEYTLLFFGSSRTHRGFVPSLFDARTKERGLETHSFNFGMPGASAVDAQHMLARVAQTAPGHVDYVFVDPERLNVAVDTRNSRARSVIDWHEPRITWLITRYVLERPGTP